MTDESNQTESRLHITAEGRVQGVGFRYFVVEKAIPLELKGWVRNTSQGAVEVVAEGKRAALEALLEAVRSGPRGAYVTHIQQEWLKSTGEFSRFFIARNE